YLSGHPRPRRGFDFLGVEGSGATARLTIYEVKAYSSVVPVNRFTSFGLGNGGPRVLDINIQHAIKAIRDDTTLSDLTKRTLIRQLRKKRATIRIIAPRSPVPAGTAAFIQSETGFSSVQVGY